MASCAAIRHQWENTSEGHKWFGDGGLDLTLRCKSEDDDPGAQYLELGENFEFSFKPMVFGNTQFHCTFRWQGACHWFDIYIQERDAKSCEDCSWSVKQTAPCRIQPAEESPLCYPWNDSTCV